MNSRHCRIDREDDLGVLALADAVRRGIESDDVVSSRPPQLECRHHCPPGFQMVPAGTM
jgi:hypothetical protein